MEPSNAQDHPPPTGAADAEPQQQQQQQPQQQRVGKRNGSPQMDIYTSDSYKKKLGGLVEHLKATLSEFTYDARSLATLLGGMQQFVESAYGKDALSKPFPKLPASVFHDIRAGGAVAAIARTCAGSLKQKKQKRIDWMSPAHRKENMELITRVRQELLRGGFMRNPKIYLDTNALKTDSLLRLRNIVTKLGGQLAQSKTEEGVTHIVVANSSEVEKDDGEEYLRTMEIDGDMAKVHWWYLPDSYNEWIPIHAAPTDIDPDVVPPHSRPWQVYERWVYDSEKYNEWMNEGDYETEEASEENKRLRSEAATQAGEHQDDGPQKKKTKKEIRLAEIAAEVVPGAARVVSPGVIERQVVHVHPKTLDPQVPTVDLSHGYRQRWQGTMHCGSNAENNSNNNEARHTIPFAALWFNTKFIHHIELREFIEFQKEFKGPGWNEYKIMRNHIISIFRKNPTRRLRFKDVSNVFYADSLLVLKIFKFLTRWGIINHINAEEAGYDPGKHASTTSHTGLDSILDTKRNPFSADKAFEIWIAGGRNSKTRVRRGAISKTKLLPTGHTIPEDANKKRFCCARPWVECSKGHYTCTLDDRIILCPEAFHNGEFAPGTAAKDYTHSCMRSNKNNNHSNSAQDIKAPPPSSEDGIKGSRKPWSPQEDLLLLEAILKHKVSHKDSVAFKWNQIASAVGGRTESECVQRFLEFPIEESLILGALDLEDHFPSLTLGPDGAPIIPSRYYRAPYNSVDLPVYKRKDDINPLIGNIATLLYIIGPEVASVAAHKALDTLLQDTPPPHSEDMEKEQFTDKSSLDPMRYGVDITLLRKASFFAISEASIRAQELAHERLQSMHSLIFHTAEIQLQRLWEKCDYLTALQDTIIPSEIDRAVGVTKKDIQKQMAELLQRNQLDPLTRRDIHHMSSSSDDDDDDHI